MTLVLLIFFSISLSLLGTDLVNNKKLLLIKDFYKVKSAIQDATKKIAEELKNREAFLLSSAEVNSHYQLKIAQLNEEANKAIKLHLAKSHELTEKLIER